MNHSRTLIITLLLTCISQSLFCQFSVIKQSEGIIYDYWYRQKFDYDVIQQGNKYYFVADDQTLIETDGTEKGTRKVDGFQRGTGMFHITATSKYIYYITNAGGSYSLQRLDPSTGDRQAASDALGLNSESKIDMYGYEDRIAVSTYSYNFKSRQSTVLLQTVHDEDPNPVAYTVAGGFDGSGRMDDGLVMAQNNFLIGFNNGEPGKRFRMEAFSYSFNPNKKNWSLLNFSTFYNKGQELSSWLIDIDRKGFFLVADTGKWNAASMRFTLARWNGKAITYPANFESSNGTKSMWAIKDWLLITIDNSLFGYNIPNGTFKKIITLAADKKFDWIQKKKYFLSVGDKILCQLGTKESYGYSFQLTLIDPLTGTTKNVSPPGSEYILTKEYYGNGMKYVYTNGAYIYYFAEQPGSVGAQLFRYPVTGAAPERLILPDTKKEKYLAVHCVHQTGNKLFLTAAYSRKKAESMKTVVYTMQE